MSALAGLGISYAYVFAVIGASTLLLRSGRLSAATARKAVHIGVSHWWLIMMATMDDPLVALVGPLSFILINGASLRLHLFKAMEEGQEGRNYGTIWFPLSLLALLALCQAGFLETWEAGVGVLVMGWGDGLAAIAGKRFGKRPAAVLGSEKSAAGSVAMFLVSFAVVLGMALAFGPPLPAGSLVAAALATAAFATLVELATPFGLDNITVPILTALFWRRAAAGGLAGAFLAAALLNAIVALGAWRRRAVDPGGAVLGTVVGTALLSAGGIPSWSLLAAFFLSSTVIGRYSRARRKPSGIEEKGDRRDAAQVLANCGLSTAAALLYAATGDGVFLVAFASGFAAANADTWASEIGILWRALPRHILSGREVPAGASGGVSPLGFLASLLGSAFIALVFALGFGQRLGGPARAGETVLIVVAGGFAGSLVDSLLGAAFQARYTCWATGRLTERPATEGRPNVLSGGLRWVTNDAVNFASGLVAVAASALAWLSLS